MVAFNLSDNLRIKLKSTEPLNENVMVVLYAKFPEVVNISGNQNIDLA